MNTPESMGYSARDCGLVQDWHSCVPVEDIAKDYAIHKNTIRKVWARAVGDGLLPARRRDHVCPSPFMNDDGGPLVSLADCDRLLDALKREHGNDARRRLDDVSISDRKHSHLRAWVIDEVRGRDAECRPTNKRSKRK